MFINFMLCRQVVTSEKLVFPHPSWGEGLIEDRSVLCWCFYCNFTAYLTTTWNKVSWAEPNPEELNLARLELDLAVNIDKFSQLKMNFQFWSICFCEDFSYGFEIKICAKFQLMQKNFIQLYNFSKALDWNFCQVWI